MTRSPRGRRPWLRWLRRPGWAHRWPRVRWPAWTWAATTGAAFVGVYLAFRRVFPDDAFGGRAYRYRDDALISLSHARGLVDVGTASIGVSGARVEGFSSPLQFGLASGWYRLGFDSAHAFLDLQVVLATFVLGVAGFATMRLAAPSRPKAVAAGTAVLAIAAAFTVYSVFGWHASGMENSMTNALVVSTVAAIALAVERGRGLAAAGLVAGVLSVSRVEFVVHAAPLLAVGAVAAWTRWRSARPVVQLVAPAAVLWLLVQALRVRYFGALEPNTGAAQGIDVEAALEAWAGVLWPLLLIPAVLAAVMWRSDWTVRTVLREWWTWVLVAGSAQVAVLLAIAEHDDAPLPGIDALGVAATRLGLWWWLLGAGAVVVLGLWQGRLRLVHALLGTVVVSGLAHMPVFGGARLAGERVLTFVIVPLVVLLAASAAAIEWPALVGGRRADRVLLILGGAAVLLAFNGLWASRDDWHGQVGLCCDQEPLSTRILERVAMVERDTRLPAPMVANADIGWLSLQKEVNVTDLGLLGDPLLAQLWHRAAGTGRTGLVVDYLNHYATPDVVEAHGVWSCQYAPWFASAEFQARYRKVWDDGWTTSFVAEACPASRGLGGGIWVRDDYEADVGGREVALARALARDPAPARVRRALRDCRDGDAEWSCQYVTRSVFRNLKAFADAGTLDRTVALFRGPTARYDRAVLGSRGDGEWFEPAVEHLLARRTGPGA